MCIYIYIHIYICIDLILKLRPQWDRSAALPVNPAFGMVFRTHLGCLEYVLWKLMAGRSEGCTAASQTRKVGK